MRNFRLARLASGPSGTSSGVDGFSSNRSGFGETGANTSLNVDPCLPVMCTNPPRRSNGSVSGSGATALTQSAFSRRYSAAARCEYWQSAQSCSRSSPSRSASTWSNDSYATPLEPKSPDRKLTFTVKQAGYRRISRKKTCSSTVYKRSRRLPRGLTPGLKTTVL